MALGSLSDEPTMLTLRPPPPGPYQDNRESSEPGKASRCQSRNGHLTSPEQIRGPEHSRTRWEREDRFRAGLEAAAGPELQVGPNTGPWQPGS